jgi:hypothetical protein
MSTKTAKKVACKKCGKKIATAQLGNHDKWKHRGKPSTKSVSRNGSGSLLTILRNKRKRLEAQLHAFDHAIAAVRVILK